MKWIKKSRQTHLQDFEDIYHDYKKYLYTIAYNITGNIEDAEDAMQNCCIRILDNVEKISEIDLEQREVIWRQSLETVLLIQKRTSVKHLHRLKNWNN